MAAKPQSAQPVLSASRGLSLMSRAVAAVAVVALSLGGAGSAVASVGGSGVEAAGGYCPASRGGGGAVTVTNDTPSAQFHEAPDGLLVEGIAFYSGLVRNDSPSPVIVAEIKVCSFAEDGALLGVQSIRDSFRLGITVDQVIPANSYSPFSKVLTFDDGPFLMSVADVASTRTAVTYERTSRKSKYGKVKVSKKGSTAKVQVARVKAWNPKKRARYENVVVIFFDSGRDVIGLHHKYVRVPARGKKTLVYKHAGYPTQPPAAHVLAYARVK